MTNTLTWDIKPIALPKVNANLLSVVSLILLLTMAFMTVAVIAICESERDAAYAARDAAYAALEELKKAGKRLVSASILLSAAVASRIPFLIKRAWHHYVGCLKLHEDAKNAAKEANAKFKEAVDKWEECLESHGADSGGNSSGSNNG